MLHHRSSVLVGLLSTLILFSGASLALSQELTGVLYGRVLSPDAEPLPGATVTVTSPQLIRSAEVRVTGPDGQYRIPLLPPGTYAVRVELDGFATVSREGVRLAAGESIGVNVTLELAAVEETVTVTGQPPLVDVRSSQNRRTVGNDVIENIPIGRDFDDLIETLPGVIDTGYDFAPAQTIHGSTPRESSFNVDGANTNDNAVGYMFSEIPFDMIQEVQATTAGVSAEFGDAGGGVFNFITKSGGNQFSGGANFFGQTDGLAWDNIDDEQRAQGLSRGSVATKNHEYGGFLGGPVMRDRAWFFGNVRWRDFEETQPGFTGPDPRIDAREIFGKLTTQVTSRLQVQGSYTRRDRTEFPSNAGFTVNDAPESWQTATRDQHIANIGVTAVLSDTTFVEGRYSKTFANFGSEFPQDTPGYQDIATGRRFGGWTGVSGETIKRDKQTIKANVSHFRDQFLGGQHDFKVGVETEFAPFLWTREIPGDMFHLLNDGEPHRVRLYDTPRELGFNVTRHSAYVQDDWTVGSVTMNLGVRLEANEGWLPEQTGGGGRWFPVERFPEIRNAIDLFSVAPRLGLAVALGDDQRTTVRASLGRYYHAVLNQHVVFTNPNNASFQEYDWIDLNGDLVFQDGEQGVLRRDRTVTSSAADPDLEQPYVDIFSVGLDHQLGAQLVVSVAGVYKRERDIFEDVDLGLPFSAYNELTVINPIDGNPMSIFALDPSHLGAQSVSFLTNPNDPLELKRDYKGLEFMVRKLMSNNWQGSASLNLGRAEGNIGNSFGASFGGSNIYDDPNSLINLDGPLDVDTPVQIKLQGTYVAPFDVLVSGYYQGISGFPVTPQGGFPTDIPGARTVRFTSEDNPGIVVESFIEVPGEPRGSSRFGFRHLVSFRAEKRFDFGRYRIALIGDVFNLLNINEALRVQSIRFGHPNFMKPARIESPRIARLGARFEF